VHWKLECTKSVKRKKLDSHKKRDFDGRYHE
jgi:hypothetical protein